MVAAAKMRADVSRPEKADYFFGYAEGVEEVMSIQMFVFGKYLRNRGYFEKEVL